jgi:hypothetical protein
MITLAHSGVHVRTARSQYSAQYFVIFIAQLCSVLPRSRSVAELV